MELIDLEAHFLTHEFAEYVGGIEPPLGTLGQQRSTVKHEKLLDLGEGRIKDMDEAGINMQVLSLFQPPHIQRFEPSVAMTWAKKPTTSCPPLSRNIRSDLLVSLPFQLKALKKLWGYSYCDHIIMKRKIGDSGAGRNNG
ncbi:hypothetical protein ACFLYF_02210 [Chloroflexota bacterium]